MNRLFPLVVLIWANSVCGVFAQENVTIPKSRLEELERKEAELEKLKGTTAAPQPEIQNSTTQKQEVVPNQNAPHTIVSSAAPPAASTPSLSSLPPLEDGAVISAVDLAAHYRADPAAADLRYRKHTFQIRGEIAGFEKPMLLRDYYILLKTADPQTRVVCDFYPPDKFKAVFTINSGTALVGLLAGETRVPLAKVGDTVLIEGRCKGPSSGGVRLTDCELKSH